MPLRGSGRHSGSPFDEPLYWNAGRDYGREALGRLMWLGAFQSLLICAKTPRIQGNTLRNTVRNTLKSQCPLHNCIDLKPWGNNDSHFRPGSRKPGWIGNWCGLPMALGIFIFFSDLKTRKKKSLCSSTLLRKRAVERPIKHLILAMDGVQ